MLLLKTENRKPKTIFREKPVSRSKIFALLILAGLAWACGEESRQARVERVLKASWQSYVRHYISPEGRVVIPERRGETISEAQAYALLRAVWTGDAATFARVYGWTLQNLSREKTHGDHLLAWHWGRQPDGAWGVLDSNTASDADLDYALALILGGKRGWRPPPDLPSYLGEARRVQQSILDQEVVRLPNGELLLTPGNWHEAAPPYLVNPSYFSPAAYRLWSLPLPDKSASPAGGFVPSPLRGEGQGGGEKPLVQERERMPKNSAWGNLHRVTYLLLHRLAQGLGEQPGVGLFPDWCRVDGAGQPQPARTPERGSDFGWEAARLPWRLALAVRWFKDEAAARLLKDKFLPFFKKEWQAKGRLAAVYHYDGAPAVDYESPVIYAGVLAAALAAGDRDFADLMAEKILSFYRQEEDRAYFVTPDNYYAQNWAWLGLALYAGWANP